MTTTILPPISTSDAELITASRNGNREAFGQIVRKYQSMISGLIYAACGDLHRSEDVAQETFIAAWKSLSGLRDPTKLPGWLCQIARRRIADHFRETTTQKVHLQEHLAQQETVAADPTDPALVAEENEMLWRTLAQIPQPYRETLVLYYRQGQSTAEVAAAMETTDAGVRQRLTRGRQMLREEMAAMVERNLAKSAPGPEFSLAVMAALPLATTPAAALTAAKGSAAAKGGFLFFLLNWIAPFLGMLSMGLITFDSIRRAETSRGKKFLVGYWIIFWSFIAAWVVACVFLVSLGRRLGWDYPRFIPVFSAAGCLYGMGMLGIMAWSAQSTLNHKQFNGTWKRFGSFWPKFIFLAPLIYSGIAWMVSLSLRAHDHLSASLIVISALVGTAICTLRNNNERLWRRPLQMACESWLLMIAITLIAMNLRLRAWTAVIDHVNVNDLVVRMPLWSINFFGAILVLWTVAIMLRQKPQSEREMRS